MPLERLARRLEAEAIAWRDRIRSTIREGTFDRPEGSGRGASAEVRLTLGDVADRYLAQHVRREGRREGGRKLMETYLARIRRAEVPAAQGTTVRLEAKPIDAVTTADVEHIRVTWRRRTKTARGGRVGADRAIKRLRHLFNWAIEHGFPIITSATGWVTRT